MKKSVLIISMLVAMLVLESFAFAEAASMPATSTTTAAPAMPEAKKAPASKSLVRTIGAPRKYVPGQLKKESLEQTAKAFAPGQLKKAAGVKAASSFAPGHYLEASARKKQIFDDLVKKAKPQKPVKGVEKTYRGTPYKPQQEKHAGKYY